MVFVRTVNQVLPTGVVSTNRKHLDTLVISTDEINEVPDRVSAKHEGIRLTPELIAELIGQSEIKEGSANSFLSKSIGAAEFLLEGPDAKRIEQVLQAEIDKHVFAYKEFYGTESSDDAEVKVPSASRVIQGTLSSLREASEENRFFTFSPQGSLLERILIIGDRSNPQKNKFLVSFENDRCVYILESVLEKLKSIEEGRRTLGCALVVNAACELYLQDQGIDSHLAHKIADSMEKALLNVQYERDKGFISPSPLNKTIKDLVPDLLGSVPSKPHVKKPDLTPKPDEILTRRRKPEIAKSLSDELRNKDGLIIIYDAKQAKKRLGIKENSNEYRILTEYFDLFDKGVLPAGIDLRNEGHQYNIITDAMSSINKLCERKGCAPVKLYHGTKDRFLAGIFTGCMKARAAKPDSTEDISLEELHSAMPDKFKRTKGLQHIYHVARSLASELPSSTDVHTLYSYDFSEVVEVLKARSGTLGEQLERDIDSLRKESRERLDELEQNYRKAQCGTTAPEGESTELQITEACTALKSVIFVPSIARFLAQEETSNGQSAAEHFISTLLESVDQDEILFKAAKDRLGFTDNHLRLAWAYFATSDDTFRSSLSEIKRKLQEASIPMEDTEITEGINVLRSSAGSDFNFELK